MYLKISRREVDSLLIFFSIFLFCCFFSGTKITTFISLMTFGVFLWLIYKKRPRFFTMYFAIVFSFLSGVISLILIELTPLYLSEIQSFTSFKGSIPYYLLVIFILILTILYFDKRIDFKNNKNISYQERQESHTLWVLTIIVFFLYLGLFLQVYKTPSFTLRLERIAYSNIYGVRGFWAKLAGFSYPLVVIPLYMGIVSKSLFKKVFSIFTVILLFFYALWTGNKFGPFLIILYNFLIIYSDNRNLNNIRKMIIVAGCSLFLLLFLSVTITHLTSANTEEDYFIKRLAAQNEIYWKIYEEYNGKPHLNELDQEISGQFLGSDIISDNIRAEYGIYKMMYLVSSTSSIDRFLAGGYRYTYCGYASMLYYFGYLGPILYSFCSGFIFVYFIKKFLYYFYIHDYIRAIIFIRFFIISQTAINMFLFNQFLDFISIGSYLYLLFLRKKRIKYKV